MQFTNLLSTIVLWNSRFFVRLFHEIPFFFVHDLSHEIHNFSTIVSQNTQFFFSSIVSRNSWFFSTIVSQNSRFFSTIILRNSQFFFIKSFDEILGFFPPRSFFKITTFFSNRLTFHFLWPTDKISNIFPWPIVKIAMFVCAFLMKFMILFMQSFENICVFSPWPLDKLYIFFLTIDWRFSWYFQAT